MSPRWTILLFSSTYGLHAYRPFKQSSGPRTKWSGARSLFFDQPKTLLVRATLRSSILETTTAQAASPVMLMVVRPMSKIRSMPATSAMPSTGIFTLWSTMASITMPAPGTPAVPIDAKVAVSTMVAIWPMVRSIP